MTGWELTQWQVDWLAVSKLCKEFLSRGYILCPLPFEVMLIYMLIVSKCSKKKVLKNCPHRNTKQLSLLSSSYWPGFRTFSFGKEGKALAIATPPSAQSLASLYSNFSILWVNNEALSCLEVQNPKWFSQNLGTLKSQKRGCPPFWNHKWFFHGVRFSMCWISFHPTCQFQTPNTNTSPSNKQPHADYNNTTSKN